MFIKIITQKMIHLIVFFSLFVAFQMQSERFHFLCICKLGEKTKYNHSKNFTAVAKPAENKL